MLDEAANVFTYGDNVKEEGFPKMQLELVGKHAHTSALSFRRKDSGSTSRQDGTNDILFVADMAALSKGRGVMIGSGARAVLLSTVLVSRRPYEESAEYLEEGSNSPICSTPASTVLERTEGSDHARVRSARRRLQTCAAKAKATTR